MAPPQPAPPPETPIFRTPDDLIHDIFLRLPTAVDLARASAACPSFRRLITDHGFLRRYRALHPPPLIGAVDNNNAFIAAQPPHPSAVPARAFTGFDFSCSSFLPSTAGRSWRPLDFLDGRALLAGAPVQEESGVLGLRHSRYNNFLVRDLAVCDPVHRRYILLPAVPGDLKALVHETELFDLETFLAPGDDEEDPLSFRVMCLVQCWMNVLLVFSSSDGQWRSLAFYQWSSPEDWLSDLPPAEDGLFDRRFIHGRFCWRLLFLNKLVLLDPRTMNFSDVNLPPELGWTSKFVIVEAAQGMLGMLSQVHDRDSEDDDTYLLTYSSLRNKQWHLKKVIPSPIKGATLVGVGAGYLLVGARLYTRSHEMLKSELLSVDVKTLRIELFAELNEATFLHRLYMLMPCGLGRRSWFL